MRQAIAAGVLAIALVATVAWHRPAPSDLERYLNERRTAGMSEAAESALNMIAGVRAGDGIIAYEKDPDGRYSRLYTSAFCMMPKTDPKRVAAAKQRAEKAVAAELGPLKKLADADGSGFVSTREGAQLRKLVEFAWEVTYLAAHEGRDSRQLARVMGMTPEAFDHTLRDYRDLLRHSGGRDPKLKDVPL